MSVIIINNILFRPYKDNWFYQTTAKLYHVLDYQETMKGYYMLCYLDCEGLPDVIFCWKNHAKCDLLSLRIGNVPHECLNFLLSQKAILKTIRECKLVCKI